MKRPPTRFARWLTAELQRIRDRKAVVRDEAYRANVETKHARAAEIELHHRTSVFARGLAFVCLALLASCSAPQSPSSGAPSSVDWRALVASIGGDIPNTEAIVLAGVTDPGQRAAISAAYGSVPGDIALAVSRTPCEALRGLKQIAGGVYARLGAIPGASKGTMLAVSVAFVGVDTGLSVAIAQVCGAGS